MNDRIAVITKRAYNARHIGTIQFTSDRFDDKDSGWRLFYGDEDDHVLDRMECFRLITLEEAEEILPQLRDAFENLSECSYYHLGEDGCFHEGDSFESDDAPEADPFLNAFMKK